MPTTRYNAGIQRAKGLLELAAALYDGPLSHQTERAAEGVLQTDSRVGRVVRIIAGHQGQRKPKMMSRYLSPPAVSERSSP